MERCMGVDESGHLFLAADGFVNCNNCGGVICRHCHESIGAEAYCLLCYAEKSIVPIPGEDRRGVGKSILEMRQELAEKHNFDSVDELSFEELEDFYEVKDVVYSRVNEMADVVPFPLYSSNQLDDAVCWDTLLDIDFSDGGSFITDPDLEQKYLPAVLDFFGSLVRFQSKKRTDHVKDSPIYDSMPEMLINFAENSRIDSGFRLLARTVRHSFDSRLSPMSECSAKLIIDGNGEVGIHIKSKIPASMKKNIYDSEIAATSSSLLGCKCTCQSGSHGDQRIVCVHTPVRLYRLSLLLHECLAENMLCELTARVVDSVESDTPSAEDKQWLWEMSSWSEDEKRSIKANVVLLMEAAGEFISQEDAGSKSLPEILEAFAVGTQKRKEWIQSTKVPPKPSQLGPVAEMSFKSTAALGKLHMRRDIKCPFPSTTVLTETDVLDDASIDDCDEEQLDPSPNTESSPAYRKIWSLIHVAGVDLEDCEFVGIRLLNSRAEHQDNQFSLLQKKAIDEASRKEWFRLVEQSKSRSVNSSTSQRNNLSKHKRTDLPSTPNPNKRQARVITPLPPDETIAKHTRLRRHNMKLPIVSKPKLVKKRPRYIKCHMPGCPVNNKNPDFNHVVYHKVPAYPAELKSPSPKKTSIANRQARLFHRREMLRRMLIDPNSDSTYIVCERHEFEQKSYGIPIKSGCKSWYQSYKLTLPKDVGPKSTQNISENSGGLGSDRQLQRVLLESREIIQKGWVLGNSDTPSRNTNARVARAPSLTAELRAVEAERDFYKLKAQQHHADAVSATLALNQTLEQSCPNQHVKMNARVQNLASLDTHIRSPALDKQIQGKRFFETKMSQSNKQNTSRKMIVREPPTVDLTISDDEVKRRTGFPSLHMLLVYIFIASNGNIAVITQRNSSLTWFEEWFLHFEYKWGRTLSRLWDIEKSYGPKRRILRKLIAHKYNLESKVRKMWPVYVSHEEDIALRKPKWSTKYPRSQRIVMWDMTNIEAYGFSDTDLSRLTYSKYYNQNCFKGGVFVQLCGWIGTAALWPGAVSDSDYNRREGYLRRQEAFANHDLVELEADSGNYEVLPFTNIYDKGYRAKAVAWKTGRQHVLQPDWAESDKQFKRSQTLRSASIATDRAGNERGVNVCKRSWFVSRGFTPNMNPILISNAWATWSFQANFMFNPVL